MNTTATPRIGTDNSDICTVLTRLIGADDAGSNDGFPHEQAADTAARMHDFMLDHAHNEARLAQVLRELAAEGGAQAA